MEPYDSVLVFKPQGEVMGDFPSLTKEAFVLVLQTEFQMALYKEYSSKILCIDATHGTNAYRFKLITCIVPDKFGRGKKGGRILIGLGLGARARPPNNDHIGDDDLEVGLGQKC